MEAGPGAGGGDDCRQEEDDSCSWSSVRAAVHELRRSLAPLSAMSPAALSFRRLCPSRSRVYFLRTPHQGWEMTLLYADVHHTQQPTDVRLEWKPLIESSFALGAAAASGRCSREEQLLWERQRVAAWGIASYELHVPSGRVLFPCASSLFVAVREDNAPQSGPLVPRVLATGGGGAPLTPAMCPRAPRLVAYAARGDVWLAGGSGVRWPTRLSYACKGADRLADDPRQAGVPCYVTQEEFSRYTGFWWQPKSNDDVYRIVYEEVDESEVKIYSFPSSQTSSGDTEEFRFPRAGTPNAKSTLRLVQFRLQPSSPVTVLDYYQERGEEDPRRGPYAGGASGECADSAQCEEVRWFDLRRPLEESFPWCEYVARVGWTPCGNFVWTQILDRKQQRLELVLIHVGEFSEPFHYERGPRPASPEGAPEELDADLPVYSKQVLISESAPTAWINVHDLLRFLPPEEGEGAGRPTVSFLWASEETGHLHLYLVTCTLQTAKVKRRKLLDMLAEGSSGVTGPQVISKVALTAGSWEVIGRKIWVDETNKLVYFVGLRETPLERHLYVASYAHPDPGDVQLLTEVGHSCNVDMDEECTLAVVTYSSVSSEPATRVCRVQLTREAGGGGGGGVTPRVALVAQGVLMPRACSVESTISELSEHGRWNGSRESSKSESPEGRGERPDSGSEGGAARGSAQCSPERQRATAADGSGRSASKVPPPQIYRTRLSAGGAGAGADAYCLLWRPADCRPGRKYPTVLHVYGGPEVQTVTNSYKGIRQLRMHMLAARGFCVVAVDSRGSKHRGRVWEAAIRGKMGQVELDDQVEVLQWLAKETGCIDLERVAVHGWSYGGYLSLLGLATRPNVFKACIAGAPVTCWRLYDTAYTERYMGLPAHAPHSYTRASVLTHAPFFPDREGRLLIIHGLADENVHFCHTAALVAELVRLGKPHRLQLYPAERHSLRALHAAKHYEATLLHFLHQHL